MAVDAEGLVVRAFSGNMYVRVMPLAKWAFVRRDVSISLGYFVNVELAMDEFEEGGSLLRVKN